MLAAAIVRRAVSAPSEGRLGESLEGPSPHHVQKPGGVCPHAVQYSAWEKGYSSLVVLVLNMALKQQPVAECASSSAAEQLSVHSVLFTAEGHCS